ncbi:MAG: glycosyltransferase family 2 protein [Dehalobacter sp.]|nr:glycosyltransferase family 2 protein [Dehalobacter sp.]
MPALSVVIPLYNKGSYIARAINSVLTQSFQDFEVVVVDDGSTDNGVEVVRRFGDPRIRLIAQENQGVSAARNKGVHEAATEFIAFLDADDEWTPIHLETIQRLREKHPEAGMYSTAFRILTSDGKLHLNKYRCMPEPPWEGIIPNYFRSSTIGYTPVNCSSVCMPKRVIVEAGGFPQGYWWAEDLDLFGRIALKHPVAFSWQLGAIYHLDAINNISYRGCPIDYEEPFVKTARSALNRGEVSPEFIEPLNEYIYGREIRRAIRNVLSGNGKTAEAILRQCKTKRFYRLKMQWLILAKLPYPWLLFLQKQKNRFLK